MEELSGKKWSPLDFIKFITPSVLSIISISLYMVVDAVFISRYAGSNALASVNIIMPLFSLCFGIGLMVAAGASAIIGIELGENKKHLANKHFTTAFIFLLVVMGLIVLIAQSIGMEGLSLMLGATETLLPGCINYLDIFIFGIAAVVLQIFFEFFIRLDGKPIWAFYTTIAGGLTNISLDYYLIVELNMGVHGAGIASALGISVAGLVGILYFIFKSDNLKFVTPSLDFKFLIDTMINGSSEMVSELSTGVKTFVFNIIIIKYAGEDGVAAMAILMHLFFLLSSFYIGLSMGVSPVISFNYGSKNFEKIREVLYYSVLITVVVSVITFIIGIFWGDIAIMIFSKGQDSVIKIAEEGMQIFAFIFLMNGINILASAFFTSVNNGKISAMISFLKSFVFTLSFVVILPEMFGLRGVWLSVPVAELATVFVSFFFIFKYWYVYVSPDALPINTKRVLQ